VNFFEKELRRIADLCGEIKNPVFAGRACYGDIGGDNRVKLQFVTTDIANHYAVLKATILNRKDGEVDNLLFRFADLWGKKKVNNPNFKDGLTPHIWDDCGKIDWYVYRPTNSDIKRLADDVSAYVGVFVDRSAEIVKKPRTKKPSLLSGLESAKTEANEQNAGRGNIPKPKKNKEHGE